VTDEIRPVLSNDFGEDDLSGALLPWAHEAPIYVQADTPDQYYLPCFTDIDALRLFLARAHLYEYEVKRIGVGSEFLKSFEGSNIRVVLNPLQPSGQLQIAEVRPLASDKWKLSQC
jgi:hypothetical protein